MTTMKLILVAVMTIATIGANARCVDSSAEAVATGVVVGAAATTVLVASGVVATVKVTAAGVAIAIDCATTGCVVTIFAGIAAGLAAAWWWVANRDCAGALVATDDGGYHRYWNYDARSRLIEDIQRDYGADLGRAVMVGLFRYCGAAAENRSRKIYFSRGETLATAQDSALAECRRESSGCRVAAYQCNA